MSDNYDNFLNHRQRKKSSGDSYGLSTIDLNQKVGLQINNKLGNLAKPLDPSRTNLQTAKKMSAYSKTLGLQAIVYAEQTKLQTQAGQTMLKMLGTHNGAVVAASKLQLGVVKTNTSTHEKVAVNHALTQITNHGTHEAIGWLQSKQGEARSMFG